MFDLIQTSKRVLTDYFVASSVDEALGYLTSQHGLAQVVGGGTSLMPQMQRGEGQVTRLVDVSHIGSMKRVTPEDHTLLIGGAVTFARLLCSKDARAGAPLLCEAARSLGAPGVRHLATLAGNMVASVGNADGAVALVALDAEAEVTNLTGAQWLPVKSLFVRHGLSRVNATSEIVTAIRVPRLGEGQGCALVRAAPAQAWERAPIVLALILGTDQAGQALEWASVAAGWAGGVPRHLEGVEKGLKGLALADEDSPGIFAAMVRETLLGGNVNIAPALEMEIARLAPYAFRRAVAQALAPGEVV
jgi:carbon-monoxide dehydrogenase medium subunit